MELGRWWRKEEDYVLNATAGRCREAGSMWAKRQQIAPPWSVGRSLSWMQLNIHLAILQ